MYGALLPESIGSLVLLGAPLCFEPSENQFRDALVTLVPQEISDADPFPGSLLSHASALASPHAFIWSRLMDAAMSISDPLALEIHARVERWALDEMRCPGKLVHQIIEWLYRENRFCSNELKIGEKLIGPSTLSVPTLAVVNTADDVAPLNSLKPFADAMAENEQIILIPNKQNKRLVFWCWTGSKEEIEPPAPGYIILPVSDILARVTNETEQARQH